MAILTYLRRLPRWALICITLGVIILLGVAMFLLLPQSELASTENSSLENATGLVFSVFLKMGVVVVLLIGLAIVLRRWQSKSQTSHSKEINIIETVHLSPHRTLYLVDIAGEKVLLGATDQSISKIEIDFVKMNSAESTQEKAFSSVLSEIDQS